MGPDAYTKWRLRGQGQLDGQTNGQIKKRMGISLFCIMVCGLYLQDNNPNEFTGILRIIERIGQGTQKLSAVRKIEEIAHGRKSVPRTDHR